MHSIAGRNRESCAPNPLTPWILLYRREGAVLWTGACVGQSHSMRPGVQVPGLGNRLQSARLLHVHPLLLQRPSLFASGAKAPTSQRAGVRPWASVCMCVCGLRRRVGRGLAGAWRSVGPRSRPAPDAIGILLPCSCGVGHRRVESSLRVFVLGLLPGGRRSIGGPPRPTRHLVNRASSRTWALIVGICAMFRLCGSMPRALVRSGFLVVWTSGLPRATPMDRHPTDLPLSHPWQT